MLKYITFTAIIGQVPALIGASETGKRTLLKSVVSIYQTQGEALIDVKVRTKYFSHGIF